MAQSVFQQVEASKIQEGVMLDNLDKEFNTMVNKFLKNLNEYGWRKGVKSELTLKIAVVSGEHEDAVAISTQIASKDAPVPAHASLAMVQTNQTGQQVLFAQSTGASKHDPRQTNMLDEEKETEDTPSD